MVKEPELITVSSKGQVVIPQHLREKLGIRPKTKLLIYGKRGTVILKKVKIPRLYKEWAEIFDIIEKKKLRLTAKDVQKEIEAYRKEKRLKMSR